jgi:tellurite resistance protein
VQTLNSSPTPPETGSRLRQFPISFFAVVMGLAGLAIAWQRAEAIFALRYGPSAVLEIASVAAYVAIAVVFAAKLLRFPAEVAKELRHPVKLNFFPTISIGLVLLSLVLLPRHFEAARWLWSAGAAMQLAFTLYVMNAWIHRTGLDIGHVNPAWFIPIVGNVLVPIGGVRFFPAELSWFYFSIGIVFWVVLLTIVMYRLFFHAPLPERLMPTLFILVAPPAVGFSAYFALAGIVDGFARILYYSALLLTLLLASNALRFLKARFFLSAWAYSFPLAAVTIATLLMVKQVGGIVFEGLAMLLLAVVTLVVAALVVRTVLAIARGEICVEES